jgi:hypothetical protein
VAARSVAPAASPSHTAPPGTSVVGVWTGTYICNQGLTGMRLTITGTGGVVRALFEFYAVASNPGVPDGSFEMTGNYSPAAGLVLIPDYWINQPFGYEMVGVSAPSPKGTSLSGTVQGNNCTTFAVTRPR